MVRERREGQAERTVVAVGLTGSIGAGKSTALAFFEEQGARVCSADEVVHRLYQLPQVKSRVAGHFGPQILDGAGEVDRKRLAEAVQGRAEELSWLEQLTHPLVAEEISRVVGSASSGGVVVCEVPLLFESGYERLFDLVVTVEAGDEVRRRRSIHRFGPDLFTEFEALQASRDRRVQGSDLVFVNDGDPEDLREFVRRAYESAKGMLQQWSEEERG